MTSSWMNGCPSINIIMEELRQNYIFGMHPVTEAVLSGKKIEKVLFKQGLEGPQFRELLVLLQEKGINIQFVPIQKMDKLCKGRHQGVIALFSSIDFISLEEMLETAYKKTKNPLFVMLDGVSDVRNFGAIARTCECAGVNGIILPAKGGAAINAEAIKASAGALLRINASRVQNLRMAIYFLKEQGFKIVAAVEKAEGLIYDINFNLPTAVVMGSEGKGVSDSVLSLCDGQARIPMSGEIGSLNVSIASAIILFEAVRQRK